MIKKMPVKLTPFGVDTKRRLVFTLIAGLLLVLPGLAQTGAAPPAVEMADTLRADGKIWVVAGVFAIVTLGVLLYLFRLESKVKELEQRLGKND